MYDLFDRPQPVMQKSVVRFFWILVVLEMITAGFYIVSGWMLYRLSPPGRGWALLTLMADMLFKVLVGYYYRFVAKPLETSLPQHHMIAYYANTAEGPGHWAGYFSGIRFVQSGGHGVLLGYVLFMGVSYYLLTSPAFIHLFQRQDQGRELSQ
jgi:hypothetical protein